MEAVENWEDELTGENFIPIAKATKEKKKRSKEKRKEQRRKASSSM